MITAVVGIFEKISESGIRGNGKSLTMSYYLYKDFLEGRRIYANYKLNFPSTKLNINDLTKLILKEELQNISIGFDEIQVVLNSIGTKKEVLGPIDRLISQTRKRNVDVYYTTQRFRNVHIRLRQQTDIVLQPYKVHVDNSICYVDRCKKKHKIIVKSVYPFETNYLELNCQKIGELYDSNEIIFD